MPSGGRRLRPLAVRGNVAVAAAVVVSAALCCLRPAGLAAAVSNSPAEVPVLAGSVLIGYALGYQAGLVAGAAGCVALITALEVSGGGPFSPVGVMVAGGPWIAGRIVGSRQQLARQLRARNEELAAQQDAYAAEAVRYERSRIAADLHDIVGHALSLVVVQASAGQRAAVAGDGRGAARAREALQAVAGAARAAQSEVGLLAGLVAGVQAGSPDDGHPAPAQPAGGRAGAADVGDLVNRARSAGLDVTFRLPARGGDLDPGSAEVASRVVTEALTNALRHAPGAAVTVGIEAIGGWLAVTVANGPPRGRAADLARAGGGYGLAGMRDRVLARGGRFAAGPAGDGGWRVHATWPSPAPPGE